MVRDGNCFALGFGRRNPAPIETRSARPFLGGGPKGTDFACGSAAEADASRDLRTRATGRVWRCRSIRYSRGFAISPAIRRPSTHSRPLGMPDWSLATLVGMKGAEVFAA